MLICLSNPCAEVRFGRSLYVLLFVGAAAYGSFTPAAIAAQSSEARFAVRDEVRIEDPEPIGMNIHVPSQVKHFIGHGKVNLFSTGGHPEGFFTVVKGVATGGGSDFLENTKSPWASFWDSYQDGFFDGARMRIYRYEGDKAVLLRLANVARFQGGKNDSANRFEFTEPGPEVRAGDEYVVEQLAPTSGPGLRGKTAEGLLRDFYQPTPKDTGIALDDSTCAPTGGSASLRVDLKQPGGIRIDKFYVEPMGETWLRFDPEATYRFSGWFRRCSETTGRLTVRAGALAEESFALDTDWQKIEFDFAGGEADNRHNQLELSLDSAGTFWVDNMTVHEVTEGAPPLLEFYPDFVEALQSFRPGFLRIWQLQNNKGSVAPMRAALEGYFSQPWIFDVRRLETFEMVDLHTLLELCETTGAKPWIIVSTLYSEADWLGLIEFLAGPADSPGGRIRAGHGRKAPWTEAFPEILLESGNEVWNRGFRPQNFPNRPKDYARYADRMFEVAGTSPYFDAGKFRFVVNGFSGSIDGFTRDVAQQSKHADYVDIANYIGGWDSGWTDTGASGEVAYESRLLYGVTRGADVVNDFRAMLDSVNAEGRAKPIGGLVYEAGPGYSLPGPNVEIDWGEQRLGKSLASAIGVLDQYFNYTLAGIDGIGHFTFGRGLYWYTHSENQDTWQPHAVTLACMLRNELGRGDLLVVDGVDVPTVDLPPREILRKRNNGSIRTINEPARDGVPLVGCHAFREGDRFSVFLISRKSSAETAVSLDLPWKVAPEVRMSRLTGPSMMAHNIEEPQVGIERVSLDAFDWTQPIALPPHTVQVIEGHILE